MTEQEILKEFEIFGYNIITTDNLVEMKINISDQYVIKLTIDKKKREFTKVLIRLKDDDILGMYISAREHLLLHKLFKLWGWFDE